jgi:class 3 adenylate cyclase/tetratricopeptide (TPR) repeat protein
VRARSVTGSGSETANQTLLPYVPRLTLNWAASLPDARTQAVDGSLLFVDISGFTKMSERLARHGKVGAEEVTDAIGTCFEALLEIAYQAGGGLLKFGGDALLLLFTGPGHAERAAGAALGMQNRLAVVGKLDTTAGRVVLRMSAGVHTGAFQCFLVGDSHRELLLTGADVTTLTDMEGSANAGQVVVSAATVAQLPADLVGERQGPGYRLRRVRRSTAPEHDMTITGSAHSVDVTGFVPTAIRAHLLSGGEDPEHRNATVAFLHFDGTDALLMEDGPGAVAAAIDELVIDVQRSADAHDITFLGTDVDHDGGKIILVSGVPRALGDDEERMLQTLREIQDGERRLALRVGVNRGAIFAGDVGPQYRRTYTVMGDTVNLAARLMARAEAGQILATSDVLERSRTPFETDALEPFYVKGKRLPVQAYAVGNARRRAGTTSASLPLVGREPEIGCFIDAIEGMRTGTGTVIELAGDAGIGKSRLVAELRELAGEMPTYTIACDPYEATTPYTPFGWLVHDLLGLPENAAEADIAARLEAVVDEKCPKLRPWLPLLATPFDVDLPDTPETAALAPEFRRERVHEVLALFLDRAMPDEALILLEDVQWMDEASCAVLDIIVENFTSRPKVLCATRRNVESGYHAPELDHVHRLRPGPLTDEQARAAVIAATEDSPLRPHEVTTLTERAAGNPLFLAELLEAAVAGEDVDTLPDSIDAVITAQIDRLPTVQRRLLRYAAVLGHTFRTSELAAVIADDVEVPDEATWNSLDGVLTFVANDVVRFKHAMLRDTAYEELPFRRRRELHARAGAAIEAQLEGRPETEAELLSLHFFHAQRFDAAWRYARVAGLRARDKYANVEAAEFLERALASARRLDDVSIDDLTEIWEALGDVRERSGVFDQALAAYRSARKARTGDPVREAELLLKEAWIAETDGKLTSAVRLVRRGRSALADLHTDEALGIRASLTAFYGAVRAAQGRFEEAVDACLEAIDEAVTAGNLEAEAHARFILDWAYVLLGQPELAVHSARALEIYEQLGNFDRQAQVLNNQGGFLYFEGRWDEAVQLYERGREIRLRTGNEVEAAFIACNIGEVLTDQGHLEDAEARFRRALRVARAAKKPYVAATALQHLGRVAMLSGDTDLAFERLNEARAQFDAMKNADDVEEVDVLLAECHVVADHPHEALQVVDAIAAANPTRVATLERTRGRALLALGDLGGARTALELSLADARDEGVLFDIARTLDVLVDLDVLAGDLARAELREAECAELFARLGIEVDPERELRVSAARTSGLPTGAGSRS